MPKRTSKLFDNLIYRISVQRIAIKHFIDNINHRVIELIQHNII